MNAKKMTARQLAIVRFMKRHLVEYQRLPTIREIALEFGIRSPNGVAAHLRALIRHGVISRFEKQHASKYRLNGIVIRLESESMVPIAVASSTVDELSRRSAATTWEAEDKGPKPQEAKDLSTMQPACKPCA